MIFRREHATPIRQRMGDMPDHLQHPEAGFREVAFDLARPYLMKADVRRRSGRSDEGRVGHVITLSF